MRTFALSYCLLFCHGWLLSLTGLLLSKANGWGVDVGEGGGVEEEYIGVGMNIMYEKRIYFQLKKFKLNVQSLVPCLCCVQQAKV